MRIVFAVLTFLLLISGCTNIPSNPERVVPIYSTFKNSAIYTSSGDFDGDGEKESIFILRKKKNYYLSILDGQNTINRELNYNADNPMLTIQDINNDGREDIIINVIQNNCENCYVYSLDGDIKTLLSPDIIISKINLEEIGLYISQVHGFTNPTEMDRINLDIEFYYTEMNYMENGIEFVSEGSIFDKNISILNIQAIIGINKNDTAVLKDINVQPSKN